MREKNIMKVLALIGVALATSPVSAQTEEPSLIINTEHYPPYSVEGGLGYEDLLAKEVFSRIGKKIILNFLPSARTIENVNNGIDDGMLARVGGMAENYPNLVQFEESALIRDYVAFTKMKDITINGWNDLQPYSVGIIRGWKLLEKNITGGKPVLKVKTGEQLFSLLQKNRIEVVVFAKLSGLYILKKKNWHDIHVVAPPLARRQSYFYMNKKHRDLIGPASAALRQIKADGTYQKIYTLVVAPLFAR